jgi:predicted CxxxxCH...CXXCH cytochrome family protein
MRTKSLLSLFLCAAALLGLYGCAKLQDTPPGAIASGITAHPDGWSDPASPNFHGKAIAASSWDMRQCRTCHGQTYAGGAVKVSCLTCHMKSAGPENCTTCHGGTNAAPPRDLSGNTAEAARGVGAHQVHLVGPRDFASATVLCADCHKVPATVYEAGHVDSPLPVEVSINSALAKTQTSGVTPAPTYDVATGKCSNTYCHGNFRLRKPSTTIYDFVYADSVLVGNKAAPVWNAGSPEAACGTCHGSVTSQGASVVPTGHNYSALTGCGATPCHSGIVDATGKIKDPSKHMNGKVNVQGLEYSFR